MSSVCAFVTPYLPRPPVASASRPHAAPRLSSCSCVYNFMQECLGIVYGLSLLLIFVREPKVHPLGVAQGITCSMPWFLDTSRATVHALWSRSKLGVRIPSISKPLEQCIAERLAPPPPPPLEAEGLEGFKEKMSVAFAGREEQNLTKINEG